jgi:hypothetical protein
VNTGIDSRFDKYKIAEAIIHAQFKTAWIKNAEQKRSGLAFLENKIQQQLATNSDGSNSTDEGLKLHQFLN